MATRSALAKYVQHAMAQATYERLEDGTFAGRVPSCQGAIAFGSSLAQCTDELRSTLEDWVVVGLRLGLAASRNGLPEPHGSAGLLHRVPVNLETLDGVL